MLSKIKHFLFKKKSLKKKILSRENRSLESLFNELSTNNVTFNEFKDVWEKIGNAYHIDSQKLRLTDKFDHELNALDPWPIDGYITELEDLLKKKHTSKPNKYIILKTLKDFIDNYFS